MNLERTQEERLSSLLEELRYFFSQTISDPDFESVTSLEDKLNILNNLNNVIDSMLRLIDRLDNSEAKNDFSDRYTQLKSEIGLLIATLSETDEA